MLGLSLLLFLFLHADLFEQFLLLLFLQVHLRHDLFLLVLGLLLDFLLFAF